MPRAAQRGRVHALDRQVSIAEAPEHAQGALWQVDGQCGKAGQGAVLA